MFMAVAVETSIHPAFKNEYKVWYLELDSHKNVVAIGVKTREELIANALENFAHTGETKWRCFLKGESQSREIQVIDFIAMNSFSNTHFGNLPTLNEFQNTLDLLHAQFELRSIA